jgi:ketosteroid isomerase-like protein
VRRAVSQENVEIVRRAIEVFGREEAKAVTGFFDPEIEWHDFSEQPDARLHHGHEGFLEAVEQYVGGFEDFKVLIEEIFDHGDQVILYSRTVGRGRGSDATVEERRQAPGPCEMGRSFAWNGSEPRPRPSKLWGWRSR